MSTRTVRCIVSKVRNHKHGANRRSIKFYLAWAHAKTPNACVYVVYIYISTCREILDKIIKMFLWVGPPEIQIPVKEAVRTDVSTYNKIS